MKHRGREPKGKDKVQFSERELEAQVRDANPLNDVLFKYLFASKENKENLIRLLNDVLGPERRIVDVESLDRENDPRRYEGRASFLDVLARSDDGRVFHVEVQLSDEGNFFERVTYYAACSLSDQLSIGEDYDCLRPVVFISILKYELFLDKPEAWRSVHRILDVENHCSYNDLLEFQFFELPKLKLLFGVGKVERSEETGLERLLRYLGRIGGEGEMERLAEQDPGIERLRKGERSFFRTPGNLASYRMQERAEIDYLNAKRRAENRVRAAEEEALAKGLAEGLAKGLAKGLEEGRAEGSLETLFSLVQDGLLSAGQASARSGMTEEEFAARMSQGGKRSR